MVKDWGQSLVHQPWQNSQCREKSHYSLGDAPQPITREESTLWDDTNNQLVRVVIVVVDDVW